jgi:hypothetical protein
MASASKTDSTILGAAGEHYVMCQLLRRNLIAALAPVGVPNADIVVTDHVGDRLCAIQVKVRRDIGSDGGWHMRKKHEGIVSTSLFYCFVDFGKDLKDHPKCWVVPNAIVARTLSLSQQKWLSLSGKRGEPHKDSDFRRFLPNYDRIQLGTEFGAGWLDPYLEAWNLIHGVRQP